MSKAECDYRRLSFVHRHPLWAVGPRPGFACGVPWQHVSGCHTVAGAGIFVQAGVNNIVLCWARSFAHVFTEAADVAAPSHRDARSLALPRLYGVSDHSRQAISVGGRSLIRASLSVSDAKGVGRVPGMPHRAGTLGSICARPRGFEVLQVLIATVQGIMRGAILAIPIYFGVGQVGRARGAVILELAVANAEGPAGVLVVDAARVVVLLAHQVRKQITAWTR